jgi:hypothetical protein
VNLAAQIQDHRHLLTQIANLRADYAAELHFAPSSSRPVLDYVVEQYRDRTGRTVRELVPDPEGSDVSAIGYTLSKRMQRVMQRSYGVDFTVNRALEDLWGWCMYRHVRPSKGIPEPLHYDRGLICPRVVHEVIVYGNGAGEHGIEESWLPGLRENYYRRLIRRAADLEDIEYEEAEDFIGGAIRHMHHKMTFWHAGAA